MFVLQRGIQQVLGEQNNYQDIHDSSKMRTCPLMIQGLRTNKQDANSHVLFFDIEALIGRFLFLFISNIICLFVCVFFLLSLLESFDVLSGIKCDHKSQSRLLLSSCPYISLL